MNADLPADESGHSTPFHHSQTQTHEANTVSNTFTPTHGSFQEPQHATEQPPSFLKSAMRKCRTFLHPPHTTERANSPPHPSNDGAGGVRELPLTRGTAKLGLQRPAGVHPSYRQRCPPSPGSPPSLSAELDPQSWQVAEEEACQPELQGSFLTPLVPSLNLDAQTTVLCRCPAQQAVRRRQDRESQGLWWKSHRSLDVESFS